MNCFYANNTVVLFSVFVFEYNSFSRNNTVVDTANGYKLYVAFTVDVLDISIHTPHAGGDINNAKAECAVK